MTALIPRMIGRISLFSMVALAVAVALLALAVAVPAIAQERSRPSWEIDLHATGILGRQSLEGLHPLDETRLLAGGIALAELTPRWGLGGGLEVAWLDTEVTSYLYHVRVERRVASGGALDLVGAIGVGGITSRLDVRGVEETETDWLVPLALGVAWSGVPDSPWGVRVTFTDWVVFQEERLGVDIGGGPVPTGDRQAIHLAGISAGVTYRLGGR
jgi:hypothetical protein